MSHPLLDEGLDELLRVLEGTASLQSDRLTVVADLSVARGLDYYTGTVFETRMVGFEHLGSICSGGRYDALASDGRTTYPGVGISFGVTRTLAPLLSRGLVAGVAQHADLRARRAAGRGRPGRARARSPTSLRGAAFAAEVSPTAQKYGKQIRYAERRGIPFVWFPQDDGTHQVRDIRTGEQVDADPSGVGPTGGGPAPDRDRHRRHRTDYRACTLHDVRGVPVIRTHQAGTLRAAHAGQTVTLTGWVARRRDHGGVAFIDLRDASGFVQVVIRDEAVAAGLRNEFCLRVVGEVSVAAGGQRQPGPADRRDRGGRRRGRGPQRGGAAAVPDRRARRGGRGGAAALPLPRPAPRRRLPRRSGCAARSAGRPATCCTAATSSRSRRRR